MNTERILKEMREETPLARVILYHGNQVSSDIIDEADKFDNWDLLLAYLLHTQELDEKDVISELWDTVDEADFDLEDYCNLAHYIIHEMYIDYETLVYLIDKYCKDVLIVVKGDNPNDWYEYIEIDNTLWKKY